MNVDDLIKYLDKKLVLQPSDLTMIDDDRMILVGQITLLDEIKEINERGIPDDSSK